jgi:hypothetical protein
MAEPLSYKDIPLQSEHSLGLVLFWDYLTKEPQEHEAASGQELTGIEINTRD